MIIGLKPNVSKFNTGFFARNGKTRIINIKIIEPVDYIINNIYILNSIYNL